MAQELIYTSAPRGLRIGASGFCTVACTRGMAPNYVEAAESISGYTAVFPPNHPKADLNPVAYSHYRYRIGGKQVSILSRVAFAGVDYTKRSNKIAYHLVVDPKERAAGGPAWVLQQKGLMVEEWIGEPKYLDRTRQIPSGDTGAAPCEVWKSHTGDAGWAGVLAQSFLNDPKQPSFIIFEPGVDMLQIVAEALRILPVEQRWNVTFNTYFTSLPIGTTCSWRCCLRSSPALKQARRLPGALLLDLTAGSNQPPEAAGRMDADSPLIEYARTGNPPARELAHTPSTEEERLELSSEELPQRAGSARPARPPRPPTGYLRKPILRTRPTRSPIGPSIYAAAVTILLGLSLGYLAWEHWIRQAEDTPVAEQADAKKRIQELEGDLRSAEDKLASQGPEIERLKEGSEELSKEKEHLEAEINTLEGEKEDAERRHKKRIVELEHRQQVFAYLGEMEQAASKLRSNDSTRATLEFPGITKDLRVKAVGWWSETAAQEKEFKRKEDQNYVEVLGETPTTGESQPVVRVSTEDAAIVFERLDGIKPGQVKELNLDKLGWIILASDVRTYVIVTNRRPPRKVVLQADETRLYCEAPVPDILRTAHIKLKSADGYDIEAFIEKGVLHVKLHPVSRGGIPLSRTQVGSTHLDMKEMVRLMIPDYVGSDAEAVAAYNLSYTEGKKSTPIPPAE